MIEYAAFGRLAKTGMPIPAVRNQSLSVDPARMSFLLLLVCGVLLSGADLPGLARTEFQKGNYRQAQRHFEAALRERPDDVVLVSDLAQASIALGELRRGEALARRALALNPSRGRTWQLLGHALCVQGRIAEAEVAIRRALEIEETASGLNDLAVVLSRKGRDREVVDLFEKALVRTQPGANRGRIRLNIGVHQLEMGMVRQALLTIEAARVELERSTGPEHPDMIEWWYEYARALRKANRKSEAKSALAQAEKIRNGIRARANAPGVLVDWRDLQQTPQLDRLGAGPYRKDLHGHDVPVLHGRPTGMPTPQSGDYSFQAISR